MNKKLASFLITWTVVPVAMSASQDIVWGNASKALSPYLPSTSAMKSCLVQGTNCASQQNAYQLKPAKQAIKRNHTRFQQFYKGIPIWGHELIMHKRTGKEDMVTGTRIKGIEEDIQSLDPKWSVKQVESFLDKKVEGKVKFKNTQKVIYIDSSKKAHLAYHSLYYTSTKENPIQVPNFIMDANNGEILKQWNEARSEKIGQGPGGNSFPLPYRQGMFQHGEALPGLPSLGKFEVTQKEGMCHVETPDIKVMSLENQPLGYDAFPISILSGPLNKMDSFAYPCGPDSQFINYSDNTSGPVNYTFSPVNDTMYFATKTIEMYQKVYGVAKPLGDDLPLRAYTHLGLMDNAFAIPKIEFNGMVVAHQQIVIGNGNTFLTAPAQSVLGHELSHNFTAIHSDLVYEGQSGGINEAFSDMAAIALMDYVSQSYPWYWDGLDWSIGREAMIGGEPIRYMDDPSKDGKSISHAKNYHDKLNVHLSSGVFNKAFYLLAHKPDWNIRKAFQVMADANMHYWSPIAYFDFAACGVIQATLDRNWDKSAVVEAFEEVGVICPMHKPEEIELQPV